MSIWMCGGGEDLGVLAAAFEARCLVLQVGKVRRKFVLRVEAGRSLSSPEATIRALLRVVEALTRGPRALWRRAASRSFDIGYEAGSVLHRLRETPPRSGRFYPSGPHP